MHEDERMFGKEFGETFQEYKRKTYRLVPFIY